MIILSKKIKKSVVSALIVLYSALILLLLQLPDSKFHIYFLDVGQGDSIFIKTPQNHHILIDGGPENVVIERLGEVMPFFDKSIDLLVLTHPHADHVDGLVEVLRRYKVENILLTGVYSEYTGYFEFLDLVYEKNVNVFFAEEKSDFLFFNVLIDIIYPFEEIIGEYFGNLNNSSIVVRVLYNERAILLSGDLEIEGEEKIVSSKAVLKSDIFKAGHHGSKTASTAEFLKKIRPEVVVIQCGENNAFKHPHTETLERLRDAEVNQIYRNDLDGTVEFVF